MEMDLSNEIRLLSKLILRLERIADNCNDKDEILKLIDQVGKAATRKANLIKTHKSLNPASDDLDQMLLQALKEVAQELGISK